MSVKSKNIDITELAQYVFRNESESPIFIEINCLKTKKELFFLLFDLFCKGLIILYGENNKILLNKLGMDQFDEVKAKLKLAHVDLNLTLYDKETAVILEMIPDMIDDRFEKTIIQKSLAQINGMSDDMDLKEYVFQLFMNETLFNINFDIIH